MIEKGTLAWWRPQGRSLDPSALCNSERAPSEANTERRDLRERIRYEVYSLKGRTLAHRAEGGVERTKVRLVEETVGQPETTISASLEVTNEEF